MKHILTHEQVMHALSQVHDPDLHKDLVSLNMIHDLSIEQNHIRFRLVLTTPSCPLKEKIMQDCRDAIESLAQEELHIDITLDAKVTSARMSKEQVLPGVKNVIAVASGKGGVGKSTISVNLALALAETGARVGLIDADIYGPSIPTMLGIKGQRPGIEKQGDKHLIQPIQVAGISTLSIGLLVDDRQAVVWRGPMVSSALRQFITDVVWGELDYLILDLPPGTGDIHLTLVGTAPVTGAIIVTTPQEVALADARKGIGMFKMDGIRVPVLGVVENMSWFTPAELPTHRYYLFGKEGGAQLAQEYDIPLLGQIPLIQSIREGGDEGMPVMRSKQHPQAVDAFRSMAVEVERQIAIRNAEKINLLENLVAP